MRIRKSEEEIDVQKGGEGKYLTCGGERVAKTDPDCSDVERERDGK